MRITPAASPFLCALILPLLARSALAAPASETTKLAVDEEMFVPIGGIDQWMTIKGENTGNPVLLILHGGPGASFSPYDDATFGAWRRRFTVVQWDQRGSSVYERVLAMARGGKDAPAIKDLTVIGPPPWHSFETMMTFIRWVGVYELKRARPLNMAVSAEYASPQERESWEAAMAFSVQHFFGKDLAGPLMRINLPALGPDFQVPVFIVQGQDDLRAPPDLARRYFDSIRAPRKAFFVVPETGHEPSSDSMRVISRVLLEQARPRCSHL